MMRRGLAVAAVAVLVWLSPAPVRAESFVITSGDLTFDHEGDWFSFLGTNFEISTSGGALLQYIARDMTTCQTCRPGDIVNPSFTTRGEVSLGSQGSATIGGTTYTDLSFRGTLDVDATPVPFPNSSVDFFNVRTPFVMSGFIRAFQGTTEVFSGDLSGSGMARLPFDRHSDGSYVWEEGRLDYRFDNAAPTPEPTSLILLGTGLAGALVRSRRRSSARVAAE